MDEKELTKVKKCACANLRGATRVVTQAFDEVLEPSGLTITQFTLLATLANNGPTTINQLAASILMDSTTLTRNLKPLQKQNLVATAPGEDQRTRYVSLTDTGRQALETALPLWEQAQARVLEGMGQAKFEAFLKDLYQVAQLVR